MSSYDLINPTYHSNTLSIFELKADPSSGICQDPDMLMYNVGLTRGDTTANLTLQYPANTGILASIKSMSISINGEDIETNSDLGNIAAINNMKQDNGKAYNILSKSIQYTNSFFTEGNKIYAYGNPNQLTSNTLSASTSPNPRNGYVALTSVSGLLNAMNSATPKVAIHPKFLSLKITVEWETDPLQLSVTGTAVNTPASLAALSIAPLKPVLLVKKYRDPEYVNSITDMYTKGFKLDFLNWTSETHGIGNGAVANGPVRTVFNNTSMLRKTVTRCIGQNTYIFNPLTVRAVGVTYLGDWVAYCGNRNGVSYYSTPNNSEILSLQVNSVPYLPEPLVSPALKQWYRDQTLAYQAVLPHSDIITDPATETYLDTQAGFARKLMSYFAFNIGQKIDSFLVDYTRSPNVNDFNVTNVAAGIPQQMTWYFEYSRGLTIMGSDLILQDI